MRHKPRLEDYKKAIDLRKQGLSIRQIAKEIGIAKSAIHRWLFIFAEEKPTVMTEKKPMPKRVTGIEAPMDKPSAAEATSSNVTQKETIARLERELKDARMLADLYNEMINVAEKKFDIQIRKKAGIKQ